MMGVEPTPWAMWLRGALELFGLKPAEFWRLSVREWRALSGRDGARLTQNELRALAARFPD